MPLTQIQIVSCAVRSARSSKNSEGEEKVEGVMVFSLGETLGVSTDGLWNDQALITAMLWIRDQMQERELLDIYYNGDEINNL